MRQATASENSVRTQLSVLQQRMDAESARVGEMQRLREGAENRAAAADRALEAYKAEIAGEMDRLRTKDASYNASIAEAQKEGEAWAAKYRQFAELLGDAQKELSRVKEEKDAVDKAVRTEKARGEELLAETVDLRRQMDQRAE